MVDKLWMMPQQWRLLLLLDELFAPARPQAASGAAAAAAAKKVSSEASRNLISRNSRAHNYCSIAIAIATITALVATMLLKTRDGNERHFSRRVELWILIWKSPPNIVAARAAEVFLRYKLNPLKTP